MQITMFMKPDWIILHVWAIRSLCMIVHVSLWTSNLPGVLTCFLPGVHRYCFQPHVSSLRNEQVMTISPAVSQGVVRRRCGSDGLWEREDSGQVWRDMTQCEEEEEVTSQEVGRPKGTAGLFLVRYRSLY